MKRLGLILFVVICLPRAAVGGGVAPEGVVALACAREGKTCVAYTREGAVWVTGDLDRWRKVAQLELWHEFEKEDEETVEQDVLLEPRRIRDVRLGTNRHGEWALVGGGELVLGDLSQGVQSTQIGEVIRGLVVTDDGDVWLARGSLLLRWRRDNLTYEVIARRSTDITALMHSSRRHELLFTDGTGIWAHLLAAQSQQYQTELVMAQPRLTLVAGFIKNLVFVTLGRLKFKLGSAKPTDLGRLPSNCDRLSYDGREIYLRCAGMWLSHTRGRARRTDLLAVAPLAGGGFLFSREGRLERSGTQSLVLDHLPPPLPFETLLNALLIAFDDELGMPPCAKKTSSLLPSIVLYFGTQRETGHTLVADHTGSDFRSGLSWAGGLVATWKFQGRWQYECAPELEKWQRLRSRRSARLRTFYRSYNRTLAKKGSAHTLERFIAAHFQAAQLKAAITYLIDRQYLEDWNHDSYSHNHH